MNGKERVGTEELLLGGVEVCVVDDRRAVDGA